MSDPCVPVAIVGVAALFPGTGGVDGFWRDIVTGRDLITEVPPTHWLAEDYFDADPSRPDKVYCTRGAFLLPVPMDPLEYGMPPASFPSTDASQLLSLVVAKHVLQDAAQGPIERLNLKQTSIFMGATCGQKLFGDMTSRIQRPVWVKALRESGLSEDVVTEVCDRIADSYVPWTESTFPGLLGNVITGRIANRFDLGGTNCVTDAACASALAALRMGLSELYLGTSDMVIVGGADLMNDPTTFMCFSKTPALSPSGRCRPFDAEADGTLLGEGIGMFALKRLSDAERDGDRIYAVIKALGTSSDGRALSVYAPLATGQARALLNAYAAAGISPQSIELVEAHGTGTAAGELAEFTGLRTAFGDQGPAWCALGSIKSQIGHPKAAAGAAGLFKAVMALHHKVLPPTLHVDRPNPRLDVDSSPFYLNTQARPWVRSDDHPRRAAVSSFGFGGANFHCVLEEYQGPGVHALRHLCSPTELVVLTDETPQALVAQCRQLASEVATPGSLRFVARQSQLVLQSQQPARLAVVAANEAELQKKLLQVADIVERSPERPVNAPGLSYAWKSQPGQVAFLFPGQGGQYVGMTADLAMAFPEAAAVWDRTTAFGRLCDVVFPHPVFSDEARAEQAHRLMATEWAQPAICAASMACLALLGKVGVEAGLVAGHSFGEISALAAGGVLTTEDLLSVACRRGEFMSHDAHGAMLAVAMARADVESRLAEWGSSVVVANHNSPLQVVLSGTVEAISDVEQRLQAEGQTPRRLSVAAAFHSPLVDSARTAFADFLASVPFARPHVPVFSNAEAAPYPSDVEAVRTRLAEQIVRPVRFVEMLDAMYEAGARTFVEVGPGAVLSGLAEQCLEGRPVTVINMDRRSQHGLTSLWNALGRLAVAGVTVRLSALWDGIAPVVDPRTEVRPAHAIDVSGANVGRRYPPADGVLPLPNPPQAAAPAATNDAFAAFQQAMAEGHIQYLKTMEATLAGSHRAWLESMEASYARLTSGTEYTVPEVSAPVPVAEEAAPVAAPTQDMAALLLSVVADKTGYPADMLNLDMALEADLGIDSIKRVEIFSALQEALPHLPATDPATLARLRTLGDIVFAMSHEPAPLLALHRYRVQAAGAPVSGRLAAIPGPVALLGDGPVAQALATRLQSCGTDATVVNSIPAEARSVIFMGGLWDFPDDDSAIEVNQLAFEAARAFGSRRRAPHNGHVAEGGWFVTVQNTGGDFGLSGCPVRQAWSAGVAALARTAALEWPDTYVRAIDLECAGQSPEELADLLLHELLLDGVPLDVGLRADGTRIMLETQACELEPGPLPLNDASVLVVSGGARGITAAVLRELASQARPRLALLGRTPLEDEPESCRNVHGDTDLKRVLLDSARAGGRQPSPQELGEQVGRILAAREVRATVQALQTAGSAVSYIEVDIQDIEAVKEALEAVRAHWGPITGIIHGAGVLADKRIVDKTAEQFKRVFDTKVRGLHALLAATQDDPLQVVCLFSSIVACVGNIGQCDYAMANEVLNRVACAEARQRPGCHVKAINWGPWDAGMVTAGVKAHFEAQGITPIPVADGARHFVAELRDGRDVQVVVGASGHGTETPPEQAPREWIRQIHIDARTHPWLEHHRIHEVVVLPVVQVLDWFLESAGPGASLRAVKVLKGVQLADFPEESRTLHIEAIRMPDGEVALSLRSPEGILHYSAKATPAEETVATLPELAGLGPAPWAAEDLYGRLLFHGPSYQVIRSIEGIGDEGVVATLEKTDPSQSDTFVLDGCLQLAHLWGLHKSGIPSLPTGIGRLVMHRPINGPVRCHVSGRSAGPYKIVSDIYLTDADGRVVAEMHDVECHGVTTPVVSTR